MMMGPVAVNFGGNLGVSWDMTDLAGHMFIAVTVTNVGIARVAISAVLGIIRPVRGASMTGRTGHFRAAGQVVCRSQVGALADGLVILEYVTFTALHVAAAGIHVHVKVRVTVTDGCNGEVTALDAIPATRFGMAHQTGGPCRLTDIPHHGVSWIFNPHASVCQALTLGGILIAVAHEAVHILCSGTWVIGTFSPADVTGTANRPVTKNVDAVRVYGIGEFPLLLTDTIHHVRSIAHPFVMG